MQDEPLFPVCGNRPSPKSKKSTSKRIGTSPLSGRFEKSAPDFESTVIDCVPSPSDRLHAQSGHELSDELHRAGVVDIGDALL